MNRINKFYHKLFNSHNCSLFLLTTIFLLIFLVFVLPLINLGIRFTINAWGQSYITFENVLSYLSSPLTLLFLLLTAVLISFFQLFWLASMVCFVKCEMADTKPKFLPIILMGLLKMRRCLNTKNMVLPLFTIFLFELLTLPVLISITFKIRISFLGNADLGFVKVLLLLLYAFIALIAFRSMFVIHFFILENESLPDALKASKGLLAGHGPEAFQMLLFNNLLLTIIGTLLYYLVFLSAALFIFFSVERTMVITVFLSVYPRISILFFFILLMACYISNFNVITQLYQRYQGKKAENRTNWQAALPEDYTRLKALRKYKLSLDALIIIAATAGLCNSYMTIRNDSFYLKNALSGIKVSSHRGNSHSAPENTLPALENAILAGSDYAEVDVRQTKDGVLVLLHDSNLKRTAGLNRTIGTLDLKDLSQLDAGGWFSSDFIRTKIPTLEEAILLCKGRIKLNIEIKADQKGPRFEENLAALINKYDFERQCLITSSDYDTLVKMKQLNGNLKTGLILTAAYGNYFDHTAVDFFSIRSNHITRQVVLNAHRAGKEVHAWTVNKTSEVERMKSIGVDCIITDNPTLTKQVLFEDHAGMSFLDLLNHLLNDS